MKEELKKNLEQLLEVNNYKGKKSAKCRARRNGKTAGKVKKLQR